jgi:hypothetical protein
MSAPQITVFLPKGLTYEQMLYNAASTLHLNIDALPPGFPYAFSAQQVGAEHFLIAYDAEATDIIDEMRQWEKPSQEYKLLLQGCGACINIRYRILDLAKQCLIIISDYLGQSTSQSVVENGYGCLLRLSDIIDQCSGDSTWSWERETFPDLPGVADSEWFD